MLKINPNGVKNHANRGTNQAQCGTPWGLSLWCAGIWHRSTAGDATGNRIAESLGVAQQTVDPWLKRKDVRLKLAKLASLGNAHLKSDISSRLIGEDD
jgi:hypothetical protein